MGRIVLNHHGYKEPFVAEVKFWTRGICVNPLRLPKERTRGRWAKQLSDPIQQPLDQNYSNGVQLPAGLFYIGVLLLAITLCFSLTTALSFS